jgi:hypothetical protein
VTTEPDITDVLERYNCPHPPTVVRMRFWGAINSPAVRISPLEEIDALWSGKRRPFETEDEAQAFYDVMIGFWNALAENRASGKPVTFATRSGLKTIDGLKSAMASRHAELSDGFFSGFIGNLRPRDPVESGIDRNLDKLSDEIEELMEGPIGPGNVNKVRSRFVALDKRAQKLVNQAVHADVGGGTRSYPLSTITTSTVHCYYVRFTPNSGHKST